MTTTTTHPVHPTDLQAGSEDLLDNLREDGPPPPDDRCPDCHTVAVSLDTAGEPHCTECGWRP